MMADDMALKILKMRAGLCSWAHVMERFGSHYTTANGLRGALKRWSIHRGCEISWAFPHRGSKGKHLNVIPPPRWEDEIQRGLAVADPIWGF